MKIRAAVLRKRGGPLKIEPLEMEGPQEAEVLVRITASGICHTDIGFVDYRDEADDPLILGHEGAGVVEQAGKKVKSLKRGDHVVLSYQSCGSCRYCRKGRPFDCSRFFEANFGMERLDGSSAYSPSEVKGHFFGQSSFATHALATEQNAVKVPKGLPLEMLAPLGCGMQTGAGTVMNSLAVSEGKSIAVFGTGAVGLASIMASRIVGAGPVIGVDIRRSRIDLARELGATHAIDARRGRIASRISSITGSGIDFFVDTTGDPEIQGIAVQCLNPNGTGALLAGESGTDDLPEGRRTIGIIQGDAVPQVFIPYLIRLYKSGIFPYDRLIKFYELKGINRAMADSRRGAAIKPVLVM
ncbi:MAG TPA: NAD(P)-dependent alcohol dehydrogenase [Syntrophales bacterium]|nr:NAD(P)-dependent alcohol dehydrogenase [Syntrophales bacterium]